MAECPYCEGYVDTSLNRRHKVYHSGGLDTVPNCISKQGKVSSDDTVKHKCHDDVSLIDVNVKGPASILQFSDKCKCLFIGPLF